MCSIGNLVLGDLSRAHVLPLVVVTAPNGRGSHKSFHGVVQSTGNVVGDVESRKETTLRTFLEATSFAIVWRVFATLVSVLFAKRSYLAHASFFCVSQTRTTCQNVDRGNENEQRQTVTKRTALRHEKKTFGSISVQTRKQSYLAHESGGRAVLHVQHVAYCTLKPLIVLVHFLQQRSQIAVGKELVGQLHESVVETKSHASLLDPSCGYDSLSLRPLVWLALGHPSRVSVVQPRRGVFVG